MKRAKTSKDASLSRKLQQRKKKALKQVDLAVVRGQITNLAGNRAVEMVETAMERSG